MGMSITEEEHEEWHKEHHEMTPAQHEALIKKIGITKKEDEEWHKTHGKNGMTSQKTRRKPINPLAVGGGFLSYCAKQGWLIQKGEERKAKYCITEEGKEAVKKFGIEIQLGFNHDGALLGVLHEHDSTIII